MKATARLLPIVWAGFFLSSCASMLPTNSYYEKAGTLQKGNTEISGHATGNLVTHFDRTEKASTNYGVRIGHGITDKLDLKFRYEQQSYTRHFDNRLKSVQYLSFIPKYAVEQGRLALLLPISTYAASYEVEGNTYKKKYTSVTPLVIYTITSRSNKADLSLGMKYDLIFGQEESNSFFGGFIGAGFSNDLNKWAIRPEIGVSLPHNKETFWNFGIGLQFFLPKKK